jgi:rsbT co-antagonist protein RsbR
MAETQAAAADGLLHVSESSVALRRRYVDLQSEDLERIGEVKSDVIDHRAEHAAAFFNHLSRQEEASGLFRRGDLLEEAKRRKEEHLIALAQGQYDADYVRQRVALAAVYSRARLEPPVVAGAFQAMLASITAKVALRFKNDAQTAARNIASLNKVAFLDIGVIQDVISAEREQTIARQQEAIRELSTPTLQLRDRLLILPIIGLLDSARAKQLTENLLEAVRARRAKVVVMDVTGVATVDSKVANHLIQTVAAARLMGAHVIITGLSAEVAQSLVTLGVDLGMLNTVGDLQGGLEEAERLLGYETRRTGGATVAA